MILKHVDLPEWIIDRMGPLEQPVQASLLGVRWEDTADCRLDAYWKVLRALSEHEFKIGKPLTVDLYEVWVALLPPMNGEGI